ncbi:MAG: biotin--[acetyl-CoA-carboxylase] ligase [Deltaproteobacteria bacterium]|nr:biotin--[acetyl-CoA-carboxylase] ligase [Deltaproteobacteria bacterium]
MTTRDKILSLFQPHPERYVSGQEISQMLGISRAAVWKQIKALRERGYTIEAKHALGYRLLEAPDLLRAAEIQSNLKTVIIGKQVVSFEEIDSTNVEIRKMAEQGAAEGTVVIADRQSAGRGRLGRRWESPSAVNLYCSILLQPQIPVHQAPQLTFLSAVAVAETLNQVCQLSATVKWPNDVLVGGAKIAGLLNEMNAETERIHFVILGVGINLNMTAEQFPDALKYPTTSAFLETGRPVDRGSFLCTFLQLLDQYYLEFQAQGFAPIRRRWEGLCTMMNSAVSVEQPSGAIQGTVVGLDQDGALRVRCANGQIERILAGDVRPLEN